MEKFNLTVRVCELKVGQIFWFSGNWRYVKKIDESHLHYNKWDDRTGRSTGKVETIMVGSLMKVELNTESNG